MKPALAFLISLLVTSSLAGCIVRTGPRYQTRARACPPAYHWNGAACVHNGNRGYGPPVRDHRR